MKVRGVKANGFSKAVGGLRLKEVEMVSGCECVTRRPEGWEFSIKLEAVTAEGASGVGAIRLTMNEAEVRDWPMRMSRALASLDEARDVRDLRREVP